MYIKTVYFNKNPLSAGDCLYYDYYNISTMPATI